MSSEQDKTSDMSKQICALVLIKPIKPAAVYDVISTLQTMLFLLNFFCLVFSQNIYKFLNQGGFSRQVKIILFSEKNVKIK